MSNSGDEPRVDGLKAERTRLDQEVEPIMAEAKDDLWIEELVAERNRLARQVEQLQAEIIERRARARANRRKALGVGGRILLGHGLRRTFREWLEAKSTGDPFPSAETANVLTAIVQRIFRVSLVGLGVALLPGAFLVWQNLLIQAQLTEQRAQREHNQAEVEIARRDQMLGRIFDEDRMRYLAVLDFIRSERRRGVQPNLPGVKLPGEDLSGVNFERIDLSGAELQGASLFGAKLSYSRLIGANLSSSSLSNAELVGADLGNADLTGARITGADLASARLVNADFTQADLSGASLVDAVLSGANLTDTVLRAADFSGVDLSETFGLEQTQLTSTTGDYFTQLPEGLDAPARWRCPPMYWNIMTFTCVIPEEKLEKWWQENKGNNAE